MWAYVQKSSKTVSIRAIFSIIAHFRFIAITGYKKKMTTTRFKNEKSFRAKPFCDRASQKQSVPRELYKDFMRLGLAPGASLDVCKAAQKRLLKKHHPDRHSETVYSAHIATEITVTINIAYDRIYRWYNFGILEEIC